MPLSSTQSALVFALVPVIVAHLHIDFTRAGALVTLLLLTASITQPVFGLIQDRRPGLPLASAGLLLAGGAMAATGFAATYLQTALLVFVAGLGIAAFHPQAVAQAARASGGAPRGDRRFHRRINGTAIMSLVIAAGGCVRPARHIVAIIGGDPAAPLPARRSLAPVDLRCDGRR
jgi:FSR family fosmidomycin resistance protein-like MFS transporter